MWQQSSRKREDRMKLSLPPNEIDGFLSFNPAPPLSANVLFCRHLRATPIYVLEGQTDGAMRERERERENYYFGYRDRLEDRHVDPVITLVTKFVRWQE